MMQYVFAIIALVFTFMFAGNLFTLFFNMENYRMHKKRMRQLQFQPKEEADLTGLIDTVTKPVITHVFSRWKPKKLEELAASLRMAKWDKYFTPIQYRALSLLLKALGVLLFLIFQSNSMFLALVWAVVLVFGMDFLFRNSIKNRKARLINDFPDFIRITEGYLTANVPFHRAVAESIKYVGVEWKPILERFVVECEMRSMEEALDMLKDELDLFEVREFVSLVKLTLEQGGDAKEGFSSQAEKIRELQLSMIAVKIGRRQTMGIVLQGPLLLCNLLVFGLPTIGSMTSFSSM